MQKPRVLVVEDKDDIREMRAELLEMEGYAVGVASNAHDAIERFRETPFPVVVTDLQMGGPDDGLEVARAIRQIDPETKVIIVTGTSHRSAAVEGYRVNVFAYVEKGDQSGEDALEEAIDRAFDEIQELRVKKYMLSFLTHTMRNTFAGAGPTLDRALKKSHKLASKMDVDQQIYQMISNLGSLRTALAMVDSMLEAYKLLVREPENLRRAWADDRGGTSDLWDVLEAAVRPSISRLFFQEARIPTRKRLAAPFELDPKSLKQQYISDMLLAADEDTLSVIDWLTEHFPIVEIKGQPPRVALQRSGLRFNLLFAVISELFFNALKYSDGRQPIGIEWIERSDAVALKIVNTCNDGSTRTMGSREGRNFIKTVLDPLDGIAIEYGGPDEKDGRFTAELVVSKNLLNGENQP